MSINSVIIGNTNTTILLVPAAKSYASVLVMFCNTSGQDEEITVHAVKSANSPTLTNTIAKSVVIPGNSTWSLNAEKLLLDDGDSIVAIGSTGNLVSATVSYLEI